MNLCIIGAGHVGLVTAACFARMGNRVICVDSNDDRISMLANGETPIFEPGLAELLKEGAGAGRLTFTGDLDYGVRKSEIIFVAVGTPAMEDGKADLSFVESVACQIARAMDSYKIIVEKSTVPVQTGGWVKRTLGLNVSPGLAFDVVSNPEFLREGTAIKDFMEPDRVVIGVETKKAEDILVRLYKPLNARILITDIKSAEIIKHASNCFLALKISYINAVSSICELAGADIEMVADGVGSDRRIGRDFLKAGIGYGGSCLPKDVSAFIAIAGELGYNFEMLKAVEEVNRFQQEQAVAKLKDLIWILKDKTICVWGLSFKPDTDDMRDAPSINIIKRLFREGARVKAYDPAAMENAARILPEVQYCNDPYSAAEDANAVLVLTEWNEFKNIDLEKLKGLMAAPVIVDGRNMFEPASIQEKGFEYSSIGR